MQANREDDPRPWNPDFELRAFSDVADDFSDLKYDDWVPTSKARELRRAYWAASSFADAMAGKVLSALRGTGHANKTVVALTSDHGYRLGEQLQWGKGSAVESTLRVPLLISAPALSHRRGERLYSSTAEI
jgi:arylsulfatase A-like enzyme